MTQTDQRSRTDGARRHGQLVADRARDDAGQVASTARQDSTRVMDTAKQQGRQVLEDSKSTVTSEAESQTQKIASTLEELGTQMRALAEGRPEEAGQVKEYADKGAQHLSDYAQHVKDRGFNGMMDDTKSFARRRPGAFLVGTGVLGFALGRMARGTKEASDDSDVQPQPRLQQGGMYS